MDKSAITMTADDDWWLERVTMDGEQRYPERIRVGSLENPRVYVPERTCRVESSHEVEGDGCYAYFEYELTCGHEIAWGDQLPPSYCPECGRRGLYDSNDYI